MLDTPSAASHEARRDHDDATAPPAADPPTPGASSSGPPGGGPSRRAWALIVLAGAFLLAAIIVSTAARDAADRPADANAADGWAGALVDPSRPRPSFTLTDTDGKPFDFAAETGGKLTFLYFGYTNCPDVCPVHLNTLTQALRANPDIDATVVFVSTDPERDTPEAIRSWLDELSPSYIGLTGTPAEIDAAAVAADIVPAAADAPDANGFYLVAHAAEIIAITPDDQVHLLFPFGMVQSAWDGDLRRMLGDEAWMTPATQPGGAS